MLSALITVGQAGVGGVLCVFNNMYIYIKQAFNFPTY